MIQTSQQPSDIEPLLFSEVPSWPKGSGVAGVVMLPTQTSTIIREIKIAIHLLSLISPKIGNSTTGCVVLLDIFFNHSWHRFLRSLGESYIFEGSTTMKDPTTGFARIT